jgi:hypothetical protein
MIILDPQVNASLDGTLEGLRRALQQALEIEHATIPPYLYAFYSLAPTSNHQIRGILLSVVLEEMLHMALVCNVLNAIGGAPEIDFPGFVPKYPGPLPGSVIPGLVVPLSRFSKDLIKHTFMVIEEPERPLDFPVGEQAALDKPTTIGRYYKQIARELVTLSRKQNIFTGDPRRQLTKGFLSHALIAVQDANSARAAIDMIRKQGEGTPRSPLDPQHIPAHYYRYKEILRGKTLRPNPKPKPRAPRFIFGKPEIRFNSFGVYPVIQNPKRSDYQAKSKARIANDNFNYGYTSLLRCLHRVFNGNVNLLNNALGLMQSLKQQAETMMSSIEVKDGITAGPTFDYQPTNPS